MKKIFIFLVLAIVALEASAQANTNAKEPTEEIKVTKIKVFPNPATNVVNILGLLNSTRAKISITDTYGNILLQHNWSIRNKSLSIPIAQLNSGIYYISISSKEQQIQTKFYKK